MPTVNLPVIGTVERKWVYVGGGLVVVIVGVAYWKRSKSQAAAAAGPTVDTTTGSTGPDGLGFQNPNPGASGSDSVTVNPSGAILDNASWTKAVLADFQNQGALYDPLFASETLGKYLAGLPLTQDEATLVRNAWGLEGKPPQGDLPIILTSTGSQPGSGGSPPPPGPTPTPTPTPAPPPSGSSGAKYVATAKFVEPNPPWNSTLSGIAAHYHTSVSHLLTLNKGNPTVVSANLIRYPGQVRYQ